MDTQLGKSRAKASRGEQGCPLRLTACLRVRPALYRPLDGRRLGRVFCDGTVALSVVANAASSVGLGQARQDRLAMGTFGRCEMLWRRSDGSCWSSAARAWCADRSYGSAGRLGGIVQRSRAVLPSQCGPERAKGFSCVCAYSARVTLDLSHLLPAAVDGIIAWACRNAPDPGSD